MAVYVRPRSPYWWIRIPRLGQPALRESTRVPIDAPTKWQRDRQRAKAEAIYARRVTDLACDRHDIPRDRAAMTFTAWADWYATNRIVTHKGAGREREMLIRLVEHFGRTPLADISRQSADEYLAARLKAGVRACTANRECDLLKAMLKAAVPVYLPASPLVGMKKLRQATRQKHVLSPEDETAVLAQMIPSDRALFIVAIDTLVRLGDVLDLQRDHDQGDHLVIEDSKTGYYTVPLSRRARAALDSLEEQRGVDPATVQRIGNWKSLSQMGDYIPDGRGENAGSR